MARDLSRCLRVPWPYGHAIRPCAKASQGQACPLVRRVLPETRRRQQYSRLPPVGFHNSIEETQTTAPTLRKYRIDRVKGVHGIWFSYDIRPPTEPHPQTLWRAYRENPRRDQSRARQGDDSRVIAG